MAGGQGYSLCTVPWTLSVLFLHLLLSLPPPPSEVSDPHQASPPTVPKPSSLRGSSLSPHLSPSAPTQPFQLSFEQISLNPSPLLPPTPQLKPTSMGISLGRGA